MMRMGSWTSRLAPLAEVELASNELSVPAQQRVWRDDRAKLEQNLACNAKGLARQQRTLPVREPKRASVEPLTQPPVLGFQVFNNDKLLSADPTGEQEYDESERRAFKRHPQSLAWRTRSCLSIGPTASTEYLDTTPALAQEARDHLDVVPVPFEEGVISRLRFSLCAPIRIRCHVRMFDGYTANES